MVSLEKGLGIDWIELYYVAPAEHPWRDKVEVASYENKHKILLVKGNGTNRSTMKESAGVNEFGKHVVKVLVKGKFKVEGKNTNTGC